MPFNTVDASTFLLFVFKSLSFIGSKEAKTILKYVRIVLYVCYCYHFLILLPNFKNLGIDNYSVLW